MSLSKSPKIKITVVSDIICPWCFVGKRRLEKAMGMAEGKYEFILTCAPYLLKPETPPEGLLKPALPPGKTSRVSAELKEAGLQYGIDFTGKADKYPYTIPGHALIEYATNFQKHWELSGILYERYFTDGVYLDTDALVDIATEIGLNAEESRKYITNPENLQNIEIKAKYWKSHKDITGIPCFFMNGVKTYSGAYEPEELVKMFEVVAENYPQ